MATSPVFYSTTVQYYRVNANNTAIASSNSGLGTTSPTEEILAPVVGGTLASVPSGANIAGAAVGGDNFTNSFSEGQYLYYTDGLGTYILIGQIQTITNATNLVLYAAALGSPSVGDTLSASFALITNTEPIFMRIATQVVNQTVNLPNFSAWRTSSNVTTGQNNIAVTKLERVSTVGTPVSIASPAQNIPFTIQTMNQFTSGSGTSTATTYFPTIGDFPTYVWIRINPINNNGTLSSKTMYRLTTQEYILAVTCATGTSLATLQAAGYNIGSSMSNTGDGSTQG